MNESATNPRRLGLVAVGILILAVVVGAIVTTIRPIEDLDPASPEGVVQAFFTSVEYRDWETAFGLLTPDLAQDCRAADLATNRFEFDRVVIEDVISSSGVTVVVVEVRQVEVDDPLNPYTYDEVMEFETEVVDGRSLISRLPWRFYCGG
ncbi:MAG TPA: hypothetical protein VM470_02965 [Acidimicrobiia bacterium]|nr:hypothetical protein [Acidimicrobiia bacterium]